MAATPESPPRNGPALPRYRWFVAAGGLLLFFSVAHLAGHFQSPVATSDDERTLFRLLHDLRRPIGGSLRSLGEILDGMSLSLSVFTASLGGLALLVACGTERPAGVLDRIRIVYAAALALLAAISLTHWFSIPSALLVLALASTIISLWRDGRSTP